MIDLTPIVSAAILLVSAVITAFVIPVLKKNLSTQEMAELLKWAEIAVAAAQQLYYQADGKTRKQYVLDFLTGKGYDVNTKEVDSVIESAVLALHDKLGI